MTGIAYIGLDDTDVIGSPGTGRLARELAQHLTDLGLGKSLGVTRHQLLVDDRINYTSHNSSLCFVLRLNRPISELHRPCVDFLDSNFRGGSDPGLCMCGKEEIDDEVINFGLMAQAVVLNKRDAISLAARSNLYLAELGGSGDGVIGALAAVALRAEGNSGRFVDLRGIRTIQGLVSVVELMERTDIDSVRDAQGRVLGDGEIIDSLDWMRPSLVAGKPVLRVRPAIEPSGRQIWLSLETRHDKNKNRVGKTG